MMNLVDILRCPECGSSLRIEEHQCACTKCAATWPIEDDVMCFADKEAYWNQLPREQMGSLLQIALNNGWRNALRQVLLQNESVDLQGVFDYALDPSRADGLYLMPLSAESVVLDCGAGWGTLAFALSKTCSKVVALDSTFENLRFIGIRKTQEEVQNLHLLLADILRHPLQEEAFDVVVMNGVLEWVGCASSRLSPVSLQKKALQQVFSLLKPKGYLYLAIENRFGYRYFLGRTDEHSGLRFTSILPRSIANLYSRFVRGCDYRTYTHSLWGYQHLLRQAGFRHLECYIPLPDYRFPRYILPADRSKAFAYVLRYYLQGHPKVSGLIYWLAHLFTPLGLSKYLMPAFIIIAQK